MKQFLALALLLTAWATQAAPIKVAFVYVGPVGNAGWSYSHDLGRQYIEKEFGGDIQTHFVESVPEGRKARGVLAELAKEYDIIFSTSWGYMIPAQRTADQFPEVKFEHATGLRRGKNLSTYATRAYEARYLSGMVAAGMSKTNQLGYVASHPISEVIRGINAFTLGAQSINPNIKVNVKWTNAWYAPDVSRRISNELIDAGADVLAHHVDTPTPVEVAEERGVYAIGYHSDMSQFGPKSHLVSVVHDWGKIYAQRINALSHNEWSAQDLWSGLKQSSSKLSTINSHVPKSIREKVQQTQQKIEMAELNIFSGPIKNHRGRTRIKTGRALNDADLQRMNWYVQGIEGDLKFY